MKKVLIIIYIVLLLILVKLISSFCINEIFILEYNEKKYKKDYVETLFILNISQPCIAHYNYGNVLYQNSDFDGAILEYKKALNMFPSKEEECSIRINLALAMIKKINEEDKNDDNKNIILQILKDAREVLCENGCANKSDNNGHSTQAEKLKNDIDNKIKELQTEEEQEKNEKNQNNDINEKNQEEKKIDEKEEKLKELQKKGREERDADLSYTKQMMEYEYYNGKKW